MQQLLSNEWYRNHINGEQEVMIGYSDSGKDAGRMAAAWGLYEVQESLVRVAAVRILFIAAVCGAVCLHRDAWCLHKLVSRSGVRRQAHSVPWSWRHCGARWRPHASCHLVAAAKHSQWQHQGHCAGTLASS